MTKKIIHQISLSDIGGVQKSFTLYFSHAQKKSAFDHSIFSMHDLIDNFIEVKKYHHNFNNSFINKIKFIFYLFSDRYIIHFYNNLGSYSVEKLLKIIPSNNIIFHERGSVWNASDKNSGQYRLLYKHLKPRYRKKTRTIIYINFVTKKYVGVKKNVFFQWSRFFLNVT